MKKLFALLLFAALLLSLFPIAALAEEPAAEEQEETAAESRENMGNVWGIPADDIIWYGYYADKPVAWLVLDADQTNMGTEGVYLFSRDLIDSTKVRFDEKSTLWEGSLAQEWCTNFALEAFSEEESALIPYTEQIEPATAPNHIFGLTWREVELKGEQVFFISAQELARYFGTYGPENKRTVKRCSMESYYWLRSPHYYHDDYHGIVLQDSYIHDKLPDEPWAARPCINLLLQDAVWVLPAEDQGALGPVQLPDDSVHQWKLIVPWAEHAFRAETLRRDGDRLTVSYSGADVGEGNVLSLLARDSEGKGLALTRLVQPTAAEGTLELDLGEMKLPEGAKLYLFCEQLLPAQETNYASGLQELALTATVEEASEPGEGAPDTPQSGEAAEGEAPAESAQAPDAGQTDETAETPSLTAAPEAAQADEAAETSSPLAAPEAPGEPETPESGETPQPTPKPVEASDSAMLRDRILRIFPLAAAGALLLLAVIMVIIATRTYSLKPVILFLLLILVTAVVYLRMCGGRVPENLLQSLLDLL